MALVVAMSTLAAGQAHAAGITWRTSLTNALSEAKRTKKPVFIDFTATWCGPCQEMKRDTFTSSKVISEMRRWVAVRIDVDKQEDVAKKYKIEAMPTLVVVKPNGTVVTKAVGYRNADELLSFLRANYNKGRG